MRIAILIVGAIVYYIVLFLLTKMLLNAFHIQRRRPFYIVILSIGTIPLFCVIDYIWRGIKFVEIIAYIGYLELGFFIYYILSLGFVVLIKKVVGIIRKTKRNLVGKSSILIASIMSIVICIWGIFAAQIPEYTHRKEDLGLEEELKVTVVSDIHYGATGSFLSLANMVKNINKTNPDLVLLVGDVFDNKIKNLDHNHFVNTLNKITSKYGVYAVTGNHEFMQNNLEEIQSFYEGTHIKLLLDEEVIINDMLRIAGRIDYRGGRKDLNEVISDSDLPLIVLDHQPQFYRDARDLADLQISGHTHNGQIFPGDLLIFFLNLMAFQSPSDGVHRYNDFTLAITRGYGTWGFPMRLTGPSQVMIFELK
ncbi:MAG: metallophosphoesterase [Roseburia sp.]|nr:metallophosphoesterase [Anaeroplasma bactoclasticum]MCM1196875.1 metallophosphoesterase [Roseburia sp.]